MSILKNLKRFQLFPPIFKHPLSHDSKKNYPTIVQDKDEVNNTGRRNIYYFIIEFINGLDSDYLGNYKLADDNYTLPAEINTSEDNDYTSFYIALSLRFMRNTSNGSAISLGTLNTTTTAEFTNVGGILDNTKNTVIEVLEEYGVINK